jgi:ABC-2 type transport system permease protein
VVRRRLRLSGSGSWRAGPPGSRHPRSVPLRDHGAPAVPLRRNRLALLNALILPVLLVFALKAAPSVSDAGGARGAGAILLTGLVAFALLSAVYCNLVTALVARREQLVLKRLRTGESTDPEILAGTAAPAIAIAWAEIAVAAVAAVAVFGMAPPVNAVLALVALILGTAVFALLAAVSSAATRTVEMAQVTTLAATFSAAVIPVLVLTAWIAAGGWAARRWFRWEPRR